MPTLASALADAWSWVSALPDWQGFLVVVGLSMVAAAIVQIGGDVLIKRLTRRIPSEVDDIVLGTVHPAIWISIVLLGTYAGLTQLAIVDRSVFALRAGTFTIVASVWAVTLSRVGRRVFDEVTAEGYVDKQIVPIIENVWSALLLGLTIFIVLSVWRINVTPLLASAGVIGIVVGLAARDTIANFFGSIALYADGTYKVGDYVVLDDGTRGRVQDISIRSTVIRTRDDILVTVPNAVLNNAAISNESTPRRHRRIKIPVGVAYGTDVDEVERIMLEVAEGTDLVREQPSPRVRMREFGDSAIEIEMMCWISRPRLVGRVRDKLLREIYVRFRESDIEIPFPQRDVTLSTAEATTPAPADVPEDVPEDRAGMVRGESEAAEDDD
jgi:MscS family membrane protein